MPEANQSTKKILVNFECSEGAGPFGLEVPVDYEIPWGFYDVKTLKDLDQSEPERSQKVRSILSLLEIEEDFSDGGKVEIFALAQDFFTPFGVKQLVS